MTYKLQTAGMVTLPSLVYKRRSLERSRTKAHALFLYWHSPQSPLAHPGTWEPLSLSRLSLYPLLQAPRCKKIQYPFPYWTYGLIGRNQDNPGVTVFSLASTIQRLGHAALLLIGARPQGPDADNIKDEISNLLEHLLLQKNTFALGGGMSNLAEMLQREAMGTPPTYFLHPKNKSS